MAGEETTDPQTLIDQLTRANADLTRQLGEAHGERDGFRAKLRGTTHKQAFTDAIRAAKADPKAVDALWRLSGYEPDSDEVDPAKINELVTRAKEDYSFAFLKDEPASTKNAAAPPPKLNLPLEDNRGGKVPTPGKFQVKRSDLGDGVWMHANEAKLHEAQAAGNVEYVD